MADEIKDETVIGFFEEDYKTRSMMRLMCMLSFVVSLGVGGAAIWLASLNMALAAQYALILFFSFFGAAFGGKLADKLIAENPDFLKK